MKFLFLGFLSIAAASCCLAEVKLGGGAMPAKSVPFKPGLGLIEVLDGTKSITCSRAWVRRGSEQFVVDLPILLSGTEQDWPLQDGDIVTIPEHVFPCMSESEEATLISVFKDFRRIIAGEMERPSNWQKRIEKLPSHKKTEPNQRLQTMRFMLPMNAIAQAPHV